MEKNVKDWLDIAESDLKAARHSLESKDYYVSAFLSQQAAEKALKAVFLVKKKKQPPKIHDLKELANVIDADENIKECCAKLSPTYFISRYPGVIKEIPSKFFDKKQAIELLKEAEEIVKWCKSIIS